MYLKRVISKKNIFYLHFESNWWKQQDPDPDPLIRYGSEDPDPYQNISNPEHWFNFWSPSLHSEENTYKFEIFETEQIFDYFYPKSAIIDLDRKQDDKGHLKYLHKKINHAKGAKIKKLKELFTCEENTCWVGGVVGSLHQTRVLCEHQHQSLLHVRLTGE